MCTKKQVLIFLAGAEAFHTLSHIVLAFTNLLPFTVFGITVTPLLNIGTVALNAVVTLGLLYWASTLKK